MKHSRFFRRIFICSLLLFTLAGCLSPSYNSDALVPSSWQYADLRLLDAVDAPAAELDIIAAYTRLRDSHIEIRLDLLNLRSELPAGDLYIAVDTVPGGDAQPPLPGLDASDWDAWLSFPAFKPASASRTNGRAVDGLEAAVQWDTQLDAVTVRVNAHALGGSPRRFTFQAYLTAPGSHEIIDSTAPFSVDDLPPQRAPLLLAFWNTLPSATPAQALRRWDGAHTGPSGRRHGLTHLLHAVETYHLPVTLLDLKTSTSLAALDALGGLARVRKLSASGLLLLPDVANGESALAMHSLAVNSSAALRFDLPKSIFFYGTASLPMLKDYRVVFTNADIPANLTRTDNLRWVNLAGASAADQVSEDGLALPIRAQLLQAAMRSTPPLTVLGGSLPASNWGDLVTVIPAFEYLATHPWINPWSAQELLNAPLSSDDTYPLPDRCANLLCREEITSSSNLLDDLRAWFAAPETAADANLRELALQTYLNLTNPVEDPQRAALQARYLTDLAFLLHAGHWARTPYEAATCSLDLNQDSSLDCVLANQQVFTVINPQDGSLVLAIWKHNTRAEPVIMSSAYLAIGLSDPSEWELHSGKIEDPAVIQGAFTRLLPVELETKVNVSLGTIEVTDLTGGSIRYSLQDETLTAAIALENVLNTQIPLAIGSTLRTSPGWADSFGGQLNANKTQYTWGAPGLTIAVKTSAGIIAPTTWMDSSEWMRQPEDPDRAYPPGHFLPYPLAVLNLTAHNPIIVQISPDY